jgi:sterol desaturase/sphingolipid hydroxylase (fatty acid hydroxylase superfamily)
MVLGGVSYRLYSEKEDPGGIKEFLRFMFPKNIYLHPCALVDYKLFLANRIFAPAGFISYFIFSGLTVAILANETEDLFNRVFSRFEEPLTWTYPSLLAFTLCLALVSDFSTYVIHVLHHRIPILWEFHKVHHSAEVLTPITVYRKHPVYTVLSRCMDAVVIGPFQGVVASSS